MKQKNYHDQLIEFYRTSNFIPQVRTITFQVTNDCCCACSYCYQTNKGHKYMSNYTIKQIIDLLFKMNFNIDKTAIININTIGIILDFIGGEPLMNLPAIDYTCSYFMDTCLALNHTWTNKWRASMISNGAKYFETATQDFLNKFYGLVSFSITLDGPKEIHDRCRKYHNGKGNFDDAYAAFKDCQKKFGCDSTKVTISPENLNEINTIVDFFYKEGITQLNANPIFEHPWTILEAQRYYQELKQMADKILTKYQDLSCSLFVDNFFKPLKSTDIHAWCGGTGLMLAFDPDGNAYPCLRYMESSLNGDQPPLIIGNCRDGIYNTPETQKIYCDLCAVTRRTQSTDECFNCPIAAGCAYCSAWNYQLYGTANSRCTYICNMHKARSLANVYYWNNYYEQNNIDKVFEMYLPKDEALKFVDEKEYNILLELVTERKKKLGII